MTNGISINAGFEFGSAQPVDSRLVLTNSEMLHADTNLFPDPYFAINADDRFLYIYSSNNTYSETTGYFKKYTSDGGKAQWYGTEEEYQALPAATQSDTSIVFYRYGSDSEKNYVVSDHSIKQEVYMSESDYQELETKDSDTIYLTPGHVRKGEDTIVEDEQVQHPAFFSTNLVGNHSIGHRGCYVAPENTIPSFIMAKNMGWDGVEFDVAFSADDEPVIIHDATVDRTSDGTGNVADLTLAELKALDFGSWFSSNFTGVKIPTFEEAIRCCKIYSIHAYIELHLNATFTQERVNRLVDIVNKHGMTFSVSWISASLEYLGFVHNADKRMRLGYATSTFSDTEANSLLALQDYNQIFADVETGHLSQEIENRCIAKKIPLETFISTEDSAILAAAFDYPSMIGFTSVRYMVSQIIRSTGGIDNSSMACGFSSCGIDASYPVYADQVWTPDSTYIENANCSAHRDEHFINMTLDFKYIGSPSTSSHVIFSTLTAKLIPLYDQYLVIMGYVANDTTYFMRIKICGKTSADAGKIYCEETNAPNGTLFKTTVMYMI